MCLVTGVNFLLMCCVDNMNFKDDTLLIIYAILSFCVIGIGAIYTEYAKSECIKISVEHSLTVFEIESLCK